MEKPTLAKIAIHLESDTALTQALEKVNHENTGGRITKTELASWIIMQNCKNLTKKVIDDVRAEHFDQVSYLEALVKKLKHTGRNSLSSEELEALFPKGKKVHKDVDRANNEIKPQG